MPSSIAPRSGRSNRSRSSRRRSGAQAAFDVVVLGEREVHRDRLRAGADLERDAVVLEQQAELLEVVVAEQVGPGQRRLVGARPGDEAVAQARVGPRHGVGVDAHERIAGAHPAASGASPATNACRASRRWSTLRRRSSRTRASAASASSKRAGAMNDGSSGTSGDLAKPCSAAGVRQHRPHDDRSHHMDHPGSPLQGACRIDAHADDAAAG